VNDDLDAALAEADAVLERLGIGAESGASVTAADGSESVMRRSLQARFGRERTDDLMRMNAACADFQVDKRTAAVWLGKLGAGLPPADVFADMIVRCYEQRRADDAYRVTHGLKRVPWSDA
jgi:hypothetical protein